MPPIVGNKNEGAGMKNPAGWKSSRGSAAVEFAIVAPLLLLILFGLIDFGRLYFVQVSVNASSREAARASSLYRTNADVIAIANSSSPLTASVSSLGSASALTVAPGTGCPAAPSATTMTSVKVTAPFTWVMPMSLFTYFTPSLTRSLASISSTSAMLCVR